MTKDTATAAAGKMYSGEHVAAILASHNVVVSKKQCDLLSALDGKKTASAFEHEFRIVNARAKEIRKLVDSGGEFMPVTPSKRSATGGGGGGKRDAATAGLKSSPVTPKKPKSTPKPVSSNGKRGKAMHLDKSDVSPSPSSPDGLQGGLTSGYFDEAFHGTTIKSEYDDDI